MSTSTMSILIYLVIGLLFAYETWSHVLDEIKGLRWADRMMFESHRALITVFCWIAFTCVWPVLMVAAARYWLRKRL